MSNSKKTIVTRKRIIGCLAAGALLVGGFAGASQALFSDSGNSSSYIQTGKLDFSVSEKFTSGNLLPGGSKSAPLVLDNSKSTTKATVAITAVAPVNVNNPNGANLADGKFTVELQDANGNVVAGPVRADGLAPVDLGLTLAEGQVWSGKVVWKLAQDAGNEYQTLAVHYPSITFTATQVVPGK